MRIKYAEDIFERLQSYNWIQGCFTLLDLLNHVE